MLHEHVVIVSVRAENVPHVPPEERLEVDELGYTDDGIVHIAARFGFQDEQDVPACCARSRDGAGELDFDPEQRHVLPVPAVASSAATSRGHGHLAQAASSSAWPTTRPTRPPVSTCPIDRTIVMGAHLEL